jgi:hypothetical protein
MRNIAALLLARGLGALRLTTRAAVNDSRVRGYPEDVSGTGAATLVARRVREATCRC